MDIILLYRLIELNSSINYKVCNLGSTIENTNGTLTLYSYVDKHKVWEYPSESVYNYTGVPGYYYISGVSYLKSYDYSVNSSGYVSKYKNGYTSYLYPAISTYGIYWWYKLYSM